MRPTVLILTTLVPAAAACSDEPTTLPGMEPLSCGHPVEARTLRIDHVEYPLFKPDLEASSVDVDGDGTPDNQFGALLHAVPVDYDELTDLQDPRLDARLGGDVAWLLLVDRCDFDSRIALARGNVDAAGVHLVDPGIPARGHEVSDEMVAADGLGRAPLGMFVDYADDGVTDWALAYPASIRLANTGDGVEGTIAGGFGPGYVDRVPRDAFPYFDRLAQAGDQRTLDIFDEDQDGVVTFDEFVRAQIVAVLLHLDLDVGADVLAPPDIPPTDGVDESASFGFVIHASDVTLTP